MRSSAIAKTFRQLAAHAEGIFHRRPDLNASVGFDRHGRRVRFEIALMARGNVEGVLDDQIGVTKTFLDVAFLPRQARQTVVQIGGENLFRRAVVGGDVVMKRRRARRHRFERIEHRGQHLVVDVDQMQRFFGGIHGFRRHRGDAVADKTHLVPAQHRHVANLFADQIALHVRAGDDRAHAGHLLALSKYRRRGCAHADADCAGFSPIASPASFTSAA